MQVSRCALLVFVVVVFGLGLFPVQQSEADTLTIENETVELGLDSSSLSFAVTSKGSNQPFVNQGTLASEPGTAHRHPTWDRNWGSGQMIEVQYDSGRVDRLALYDGLPFVVFETILTNSDDVDRTVDRIRPVKLSLDLGKDAADLRALGTAGLTELHAKANPGSYTFLVVADPETRGGVVTAWLTQDRGSGIVFSDVKDGACVVEPRLDYGRLLIEPGQKVTTETLLIGHFEDARLGLERYADVVAKQYGIVLGPQPTVYCTWYHAGASNERDLIANARFAREHLAPFGFSVVQIDDKWQDGQKLQGPRKNFNVHRPDGPYPAGMAKTAKALEDLGMVPGIWFMPFAGTWNDPFFAEMQDLFAQKDGKPYEVFWGGTCFDLTNPKTQAYVYSVARRIAHDWGYRYFKLDGLWTGMATDICYVNTGYKEDHLGSTLLHDTHKTHVQAYRDGLKLVREAAGPDVFLLGCNVAQNMGTLGGSFGLLDAMRIGPDNGRNWSQICRGPFSGSNLYFLHGRIWYNDPDPIYVRDSVPLEHARVLTSWVTLTGQLNASSIQYDTLSPERLDLLKRTMPSHPLKPRPVDLFERRIPRIWLLTDERRSPRRDVIGLFNWDETEPVTIRRSLHDIGLAKAEAYVGFDYWANEFVEPFSGSLEATLPAASCRILAVRPVTTTPQVIGTSRHITQGVIDLLDESWDPKAKTLSGISHVVAGDPYELRIAAKGPAQPGSVAKATVSEADRQAGVQIELIKQTDWKVRVRIDSPESRDVRWSVTFTATD